MEVKNLAAMAGLVILGMPVLVRRARFRTRFTISMDDCRKLEDR